MDPTTLRRRIAKAFKIPPEYKFKYTGLQVGSGSESSSEDEDGAHISLEEQSRDANSLGKLAARAPQVKIETILSVVVADGAGHSIAGTAIPTVPSGGTILNVAGVGPVTLPSLKVQNGKVTAQAALPQILPTATQATTPARVSAAAPGGGANSTSATSTQSTQSSSSSASTTSSSSSSSIIAAIATSGRNSTTSTPTTFLSSTRSSSGIVVEASSSSTTSSDAFGAAGGATSSTSAAPTASDTPPVDAPASTTRNTPVIVGGVVGSVAGFALLLGVLLAFIKWRQRHKGVSELKSNAADTPRRPDTGRSDMAEQSGAAMGAVGAITTAGAARGANASERSFQRVGGRKLESVLVSGGDGYGEPQSSRNAAGASFFRDSEGTYGAISQTSSVYAGPRELDSVGAAAVPPVPERKNPGPFRSSPDDSQSPSPPPELSTSPPDVVMTRPGPARNVVYTPGFSTPPQSPMPRSKNRSPAGRLRQDAIGRSHPSFDGSRDSRGSKFAEDLT